MSGVSSSRHLPDWQIWLNDHRYTDLSLPFMKRADFLVGSLRTAPCALAIALGLQILLPLAAFAQPTMQSTTQRPPTPPSSPPPNQTRPGGGLNPVSSTFCTPQNDSLRALIPVNNPVLTTSDHPTFFFYVPFGNDVVSHAEFSMLLWPGEMKRHYRAEFSLPDAPGIISVSLPNVPDYALEDEQYYRWYFHVYCQDGTPQQPDLTVNGVIQQVSLTPERDRLIQSGSPEIWHDALAYVAEQLRISPNDSQLQQLWQSLLQQIDAEDLTHVALSEATISPADVTHQ